MKMPSQAKIKKEIGEIIAARCKAEKLEPESSLLEIINQVTQQPIEVKAKPDTWTNLYPNKKDRLLAFAYSLLNRASPTKFMTVAFKESWKTRLFPFKQETVYDDLAEVEQKIFKIQFGNRGAMLVDVCIQPTRPIEYISADIIIKND